MNIWRINPIYRLGYPLEFIKCFTPSSYFVFFFYYFSCYERTRTVTIIIIIISAFLLFLSPLIFFIILYFYCQKQKWYIIMRERMTQNEFGGESERDEVSHVRALQAQRNTLLDFLRDDIYYIFIHIYPLLLYFFFFVVVKMNLHKSKTNY